jgi:hypothetical protein
MLIDISPPISSALAVYPGDTPFRRVVQTSIEAGESVEVSTITSRVGGGSTSGRWSDSSARAKSSTWTSALAN